MGGLGPPGPPSSALPALQHYIKNIFYPICTPEFYQFLPLVIYTQIISPQDLILEKIWKA